MSRLKAAKRNAPRAQYATARPRFRSGDIYAQSFGGWKSWHDFKVLMVRVFTAASWSHVGVIEVDKTDGHVYAVEAVRPCVRRVRLSTIGPFYHLPMRSMWGLSTTVYVRSIIGALYSQLNAIRAFFKPLPEGDVSECAALVREVMARAGVDLGPLSRPDRVVQRALELGAHIVHIHNEDKPHA